MATSRRLANHASREEAVLLAGATADLTGDVYGLLDRYCLLDIAEVVTATG